MTTYYLWAFLLITIAYRGHYEGAVVRQINVFAELIHNEEQLSWVTTWIFAFMGILYTSIGLPVDYNVGLAVIKSSFLVFAISYFLGRRSRLSSK